MQTSLTYHRDSPITYRWVSNLYFVFACTPFLFMSNQCNYTSATTLIFNWILLVPLRLLIVQTTNRNKMLHKRYSLNLPDQLPEHRIITTAQRTERTISKVCSRPQQIGSWFWSRGPICFQKLKKSCQIAGLPSNCLWNTFLFLIT